MPFDKTGGNQQVKQNSERDQVDLDALQKSTDAWRTNMERQADELNRKHGRQAVQIVPVGDAVIRLRRKIVAGEYPGVTKQSELFRDPIGHGTGHIQALAAYCNFVAIYGYRPHGLALQEAGVDEQQLAVLQEIAWNTVSSYSHSGLKTPTAMMETHTYKQVGSLEVKADVYRFADDRTRPVVIWIHGGTVINGHREGVIGAFRQGVLDRGYLFVSIDYRLAPETQLPEVLQDVVDGVRWVQKAGPELFHADSERIAIAGGSAGGYLTLVSGFKVQPRPKALVSFWGYGDLVGDWYSKPSPHRGITPLKRPAKKLFSKLMGLPSRIREIVAAMAGYFINIAVRRVSWPMAVSGWNPQSEPEKFYPFMPIKNVERSYPPTMLIHGDADTDVPFEQSTLMAREFEKHEVKHRLLALPGGEHGLAGVEPQIVAETYAAAVNFIQNNLKARTQRR